MKILMCKPDHFDIEYEINPWMHRENQVDRGTARVQWQKLYDTYKKLGVEIELIQSVKNLPDMTFGANGGIVYGTTFISSNHRYKERKGEEKYFQKWFADHGYNVKTLTHYQGGEGDALFYRDILYMGYGFRSEIEAHKEVEKILGIKTVSLRLVNPYFYDFDTAFCPIGDTAVLYYPAAFDTKSLGILEKIPNAIAITKAHAEHFVGNSVYFNGKVLVEFLDDQLKDIVKKIGVEPILLDMSEFKKSGGGIKCLTLYLKK